MVIKKIAEWISGDNNSKHLKRAHAVLPLIDKHYVDYVNVLESKEDFQAKTQEFIERVSKGEHLDDILPEAFALVKAACNFMKGTEIEVRGNKLIWDMVPYDVQIIGGYILHNGNIAEMKTGEGKTLVCTFPVFLNALKKRGVYVVTVNDYLAQRDSEWMSHLYNFLGLTVGCVVPNQSFDIKKKMYQADITYGTNNEFGFDYLRDNMALDFENVVQRDLYFAIVDEVDSILIDEARTPLIISAPKENAVTDYIEASSLIQNLKENVHYNLDEKMRVATLSEDGIAFLEKKLNVDNLYVEGGFKLIHNIEQALKAHFVFKKDVDYVVKDDHVVIVDEFTGRLMDGRRYSDGLHQAIEAKEGVSIQKESRTLASITFQNYFRLFEKLSGMTGTAETEKEEFFKIYGLNTVVVPTNKPIARNDMNDLIFKNENGKFQAIANKVKELNELGQPVLIGTTSVDKSEKLSRFLKKEKISHNVLNAKHHEREAEIVANAGQKSAVTIATNMAGRGTDIKIADEVKDLGLCVIGSERHESRRIDNQLRGRSGRQGDNGQSQFYLSMEDDLMRIFGGDRVQAVMQTLNMPDDMPIENRFISSSIEKAQKRVEGRNFDVRKHIVEYDDVINYHREIIYKKRRLALEAKDMMSVISDVIVKVAGDIVDDHNKAGVLDVKEIQETVNSIHKEQESFTFTTKNPVELKSLISDFLLASYTKLSKAAIDQDKLKRFEKLVNLNTVDTLWMEHIDDMSYLRQNVALQAYGQKDPLLEYKNIGYFKFQNLLKTINFSYVNTLFAMFVNKSDS